MKPSPAGGNPAPAAMGAAQVQHSNLTHVRGWTNEQIQESFETLRRKANVYRLTKDDFSRYFGGRNREMLPLFNNLDTDHDGLVDIFETFVVLIMWSAIPWEDKEDNLFTLFDMMGKGFLKIDELVLMGLVIARTLNKFVAIDRDLQQSSVMHKLVSGAMPPNETKLTPDQFRSWAKECQQLKDLRGHVEGCLPRTQVDSAHSRMQLKLVPISRHAVMLHERIERLQGLLPDFTESCIEYVGAWGRRKRWDFVMQNMMQVVMKMQHVSENMHTTLAEIEQAMREEELCGGMSAMVETSKQFKQQQMIISLNHMREESEKDYKEVTDLLLHLVDLTEPGEAHPSSSYNEVSTHDLAAITEDDHESLMDMAPPRVVEQRKLMKRVGEEMRADTEEGGCFFKEQAEKTTLQHVAQAAGHTLPPSIRSGGQGYTSEEVSRVGSKELAQPRPKTQGADMSSTSEPVLTAIADFEPPASHQTQMLRLRAGDKVTVVGQDGRGWWYGKTPFGKEGWFPPAYVQVEPALPTGGAAGGTHPQ